MTILKYALYNPVKVIVAVLFVVLFGVQALNRMPYQLSPSVDYPTITVSTVWTGATPYEVEREVVERQENVLKSLPGLMEMESNSSNGRGSITLQFELGESLMDATLNVTNKLNEVRTYPENVEKPVIRASGGSDDTPVVFMLITLLPGNSRDIDSYQNYVDDEVVPHFERIKGVSEVFFFGGRRTQMHVNISPEKMAAHNISFETISNALSLENVNISAGLLPIGRKNYRVRTVAEYKDIEGIEDTILVSDNGGIVRIRDVATVNYGYALSESAVKTGAERTMMLGIVKEQGANVLELTDAAEAIFHTLNETSLKDQGLELRWIYDQRPYINGAISLVKGNIILGGVLAVLVLLIFLRSVTSTVIIATAIPVSVVGTFIAMNLLGRSLNVISLAGIAFSVGILVDNAIVVLENIDRHRKLGKSPGVAALDGATEVWGAVLASTLTTVAVFLPVVFIKEEAGQLFRDIAIAISCSVTLSLLVSLTVIPMLSRVFAEHLPSKPAPAFTNFIARFGRLLVKFIMFFSVFANRSRLNRAVVVLSFTAVSIISVILFFPKMEYLPLGNMNMISSNFIIPAGLSLAERSDLGDTFYGYVEPYIGKEKDGFPAIKEFMYNVNQGGMFAVATSADSARAAELVDLLAIQVQKVPGTTGFTSQNGIFQNRNSGGRSINLMVTGDNLDQLLEVSKRISSDLQEKIPGVQVRPRPSLDMLFPEITFTPNSSRLKDSGLNPEYLGRAIDAYVDGRQVGEFRDEILGNIDLLVIADRNRLLNPDDIQDMPIPIAGSRVVPISSISDMQLGYGMDGIRRYERKRAFILSVSAPQDMVLEALMDNVRDKVIAPLKQTALLDRIDIIYSGAASKLVQAKEVLQENFIMAVLITYLLMAALFSNFLYPFIIMFSVPLAVAGGFAGLKIVDTFIAPQSMDVLTMLGFILLVGVVINNAILIVHQSLNNVNYGLPQAEAISKAVADRLRPIYMSAFTSILGMMPLVIIPGPGSELYRGLGSVVLGGLAVSTVFTVFLIPALLSFFNLEKGRKIEAK
ncbi:MAG: efflux RND transporter permease subunit [Deferribacteraceae bacterium]|jgi:HAE1 family hydrophobic/amphiphilic exporter-1|nr:efflux RND transporter permease subunit [Deferribacteraceae bacterium]